MRFDLLYSIISQKIDPRKLYFTIFQKKRLHSYTVFVEAGLALFISQTDKPSYIFDNLFPHL